MSIYQSGLEALRKKYGPFSGWTWGTIAAAGVGAYLLFFHHKSGPKNDPNAIGQPITAGPPVPYGGGGGGGGGPVPSPTPSPTPTPEPPTVTAPIDTAITPATPANPPPMTNDGAFHILTPGNQLVTALPHAFELPEKDALPNYLKTVDQNAAIANAVPAEDQNSNKAFADILNGQLAAGIIHPGQAVSYGNNQHGTVEDAITFYEQNSAPQPHISTPAVTGSPVHAGNTQGGY